MCPRCNLQYCSLDCYKKHGNRCTESFYRSDCEQPYRFTLPQMTHCYSFTAHCRDNTTEQLQILQSSQADRHQMLQVLQRLQQPDNDDDADLAAISSCSPHDPDLELSEHIQQKLSMAVRVQLQRCLPGPAYLLHSSTQGST